MAGDEEFELISKKDLVSIRGEIENLKKELQGNPAVKGIKKMEDPLEKLNTSINKLLDVFKEASQQMKLEEKDEEMSSQLAPIEEKLDMLLDHTRKIAKGIVAVADMLKEKGDEQQPYRPAEPMAPLPSEPSFVRRTMSPPPQQPQMYASDQPMMMPSAPLSSFRGFESHDDAEPPSFDKPMPPPSPPETDNFLSKFKK
ncbi:hypothetical protein HZB01_03100 [Candidatus Woesearchaeota archaeon]|nr:hypothetical protein [Candidatus Woesearchaeota archaeon]